MNRIKNLKALPILLLITLAVIWGSSFILIKKGLIAFSPLQVGTIRIVFAFLVMLPIALKYLKTVYKKLWKKIFLLGLIANLIPAVLFASAETGLSSSVTGVLNSLTPIFTLLAGVMLFNIKIKSVQMLGLFIGFAGSIAISFINSSGQLGEFNFFALFVIAATILYGISSNMVKSYFSKINSVVLTSLAIFSVGPIAAVYLFSTDFLHILFTNNEAPASLGYLFLLGVVGTAFALVLFNKLIQITSAVFASSVTYLIPIAAVIWGIIDGEVFSSLHFAGMVLIVLGVYIINRNR